jgi:hypothetical protein
LPQEDDRERKERMEVVGLRKLDGPAGLLCLSSFFSSEFTSSFLAAFFYREKKRGVW